MDKQGAAIRFLKSIEAGELDSAVLAPEFTAWIITLGSRSGEEYRAAVRGLKRAFHTGWTPQMRTITSEGDRLVMEVHATGVLVDGSTYDNDYVFVLSFQDGLITSVREYTDLQAGQRLVSLIRAAG